MGETVCCVVVDFSQNYEGKFHQAAHSSHFGASKQQMTLHQGVLYTASHTQGFVTVSKSLQHDACAVGAHIIVAMDYFLEKFPHIDTLHIKSDGPSTQYKNKTMFHVDSQVIPKKYPQLKKVTHNYSEAGHGKSPADGIGAAVKHLADEAVKYGDDVQNFEKFLSVVTSQSKGIYIANVTEEDIQAVEAQLPHKVSSFSGTREIFQLTWKAESPTIVNFNNLSCFDCSPGDKCVHYYKGSLDYGPSFESHESEETTKACETKIDPSKQDNDIPVKKKRVKIISDEILSKKIVVRKISHADKNIKIVKTGKSNQSQSTHNVVKLEQSLTPKPLEIIESIDVPLSFLA
ncbi:hypothetical protein QAD02_024040 [Eretmocerus hayati]|uniref:Uncharacterized protein n=1 Tax=Eretmocerus hayati TaxID=131215 RepID=A0ACC2Q2F2_9HYME|nr:hypothetical protein QAD02_024040 [Eretmocerus hayati]